MRLLLLWILNAVALLAVTYLLPSIQVSGFGTALVAALVLGLINTLVRPVLTILTLPLTLLTLGVVLPGAEWPPVLARQRAAAGVSRRRLCFGDGRRDSLWPDHLGAVRAHSR